jgi:hypothetical protein
LDGRKMFAVTAPEHARLALVCSEVVVLWTSATSERWHPVASEAP